MPALDPDPEDDVGEFEECNIYSSPPRQAVIPRAGVAVSRDHLMVYELSEMRKQLTFLVVGQRKVEAAVGKIRDDLAIWKVDDPTCATAAADAAQFTNSPAMLSHSRQQCDVEPPAAANGSSDRHGYVAAKLEAASAANGQHTYIAVSPRAARVANGQHLYVPATPDATNGASGHHCFAATPCVGKGANGEHLYVAATPEVANGTSGHHYYVALKTQATGNTNGHYCAAAMQTASGGATANGATASDVESCEYLNVKAKDVVIDSGPQRAALKEFKRSPSSRSTSKRTHTVLPLQRRLFSQGSSSSAMQNLSTETGTARTTNTTRASRNSFGDMRQTELDDIACLHQIFSLSEMEESKAQRWRSLKQNPCSYTLALMQSLHSSSWEMLVDTLIGFIVVLNCVFIGIAMDHSDDSAPWLAIDVTFSVMFLVEVAMKLAIHGFRGHFLGPSKYSNIFDTSLIGIDVAQLLLMLASGGDHLRDAPSASIFRIVRLGKLSRILRVLRQPSFNDLLAMLQGMIGGLTTLFWAIVLFLTAVYVLALVFRETFGRNRTDVVYYLFDSVPRAMFTTFRCSFGDCTTSSGAPIFEHVHKDYGYFYSLVYCLFVFVITIGLFNVISAIFVESTMHSASQIATGKKKARLQDDTLWCTRVSTLVKRLLVIHAGYDPDFKLTESMQDIYDVDVPCSAIDDLSRDPIAIAALNALDIVPEDRDYLSDILDPDNGGTINVIELVEGLRRLRGDPRRSDIVTINLMIRSLQRNINDIHQAVSKRKGVSTPTAPPAGASPTSRWSSPTSSSLDVTKKQSTVHFPESNSPASRSALHGQRD